MVVIIIMCALVYINYCKSHRLCKCGFQPKDYKIGICCCPAKHVALKSKTNDWLARNQGNVSELIDDMSILGLLFQ